MINDLGSFLLAFRFDAKILCVVEEPALQEKGESKHQENSHIYTIVNGSEK